MKTISPERVYAGRTRIDFEGQGVTIHLDDGSLALPLRECPVRLSDWIDNGRRETYRRLRESPGPPAAFGPHLPVMVTRSFDSNFPFNCGNKGLGYLPLPESIDHYTDLYRATLARAREQDWPDSLPARLDAAARFNFSRESRDPRCFATIEIFERSTFRNVAAYPLAALLFTGGPPDYPSFQVNCVVEIIEDGDPRFTFISLSRSLFEHDAFHIAQPGFRYGYVFWITEVLDKTPHRVPARPGRRQPGLSEDPSSHRP